MATKLTKNLSRETVRTRASKNGRICKDHETGRPLIISLNQEETITIRVKGTKTKYTVHIINVFTLAKVVELEMMYRKKVDEYKVKKAAGMRTRKPRRPQLMESSLIRKSI